MKETFLLYPQVMPVSGIVQNMFTKEFFQLNTKTLYKILVDAQTILMLARVQPFCTQYELDLGVYILNNKRLLPRTVKERNIFIYLHENRFCAIWELDRETKLLDAVDEIENHFQHEETQMNNNNKLKQVVE